MARGTGVRSAARFAASVLVDYRLNEAVSRIDHLRAHIREMDEYISVLLQRSAHQGEPRMVVPGEFEVCQFCYHPIEDSGRGTRTGGVCPCQEVGYCSQECQKLDWSRHHKQVCPFGPTFTAQYAADRVRSESISTEGSSDESESVPDSESEEVYTIVGIEGPNGEQRYLRPGRDLLWQYEPYRAPREGTIPDQILVDTSETSS